MKEEIFFDKDRKKCFLEKFNVTTFEITSSDLRILEKNDEKIIKNHKNKNHTEKWLNFWNKINKEEGYKIRLNPEIIISYREADEELVQKKKNNLLEIPKTDLNYRNRYLKEQFTLTTTFSINATAKKMGLAFLETKDISEKIKLFNENFNKEFDEIYKKNDVWHYWIDRGIKELATLCLVRFTKEKYEFNWKKFEKPDFAQIEVYKLKDENCEANFKRYDWTFVKRKVINNISDFINEKPELFESYKTSCIDLTQAKLIKWKIVINWDKNTYLKLKELSAKRRLFELFSKWEINVDSDFNNNWTHINTNKLNKNGKNILEQVYFLREEHKWDTNFKIEIKKILEKYLKTLDENNKFEDIETIEKINYLRDAITANMVWIIYFLQKKYPWKINLENMDAINTRKKHIEKDKYINEHFKKSNEDISRRLEWSLYRKFQESGVVPPKIQQSIFLRDDFWEKQFWIIDFVRIWWTSSICPYCNESFNWKPELMKHFRDNNIECKMKYKLENDNFIYSNLYDNNQINSDNVAWYNVAKNGFNKEYMEK